MSVPPPVPLDVARHAQRQQKSSSNSQWPAADLSYLGTGRRPAPEFPADLLGAFWRDWSVQSAAAASAPADYVGAALLETGNVLESMSDEELAQIIARVS